MKKIIDYIIDYCCWFSGAFHPFLDYGNNYKYFRFLLITYTFFIVCICIFGFCLGDFVHSIIFGG